MICDTTARDCLLFFFLFYLTGNFQIDFLGLRESAVSTRNARRCIAILIRGPICDALV